MSNFSVIYVDDYLPIPYTPGVTDASGAIQDAFDAVSEGGYVVFSPDTTYAISTGVTIGNGSSSQFSTINNNITILAGGSVHEAKGMSWGTPGFPSNTGCRLLWTGPTGTGTMLEIKGPIFGVNIIGNLLLDGDMKANKCFRAVSHSNCKFESLTTVNWLTHGVDLNTVAATSISGQANGLTAASNFYPYIASCSPSADDGIALSLDGYKVSSGQDVTHNIFGLVKTIVSKNGGKGMYLGYADFNTFDMFMPQIFDDGAVTSPTSGCADIFFAGNPTPFVTPEATFIRHYVMSAAGLKYSGTPGRTHFDVIAMDAGATLPTGGILNYISVDMFYDTVTPANHGKYHYPPSMTRVNIPASAGDVTAPTLASTTPSDNATGVDGSANIILNFSENVQAGSGNITLQDLSSASDNRTISITGNQVSFSANSVTINPSANLQDLKQYQVIVSAGVITDAATNSFTGISSGGLNFTTASAASGSWHTVVSANLTSTGSININGYCFRNEIPGSVFTNNYSKVRVTLEPDESNNGVVSGIYYGKKGASSPNYSTTPAQMLKSSSGSFTLTANSGEALLDELTFVGSAGEAAIISMAFNGTTKSSTVGITGYPLYNKSGGSGDVATVSPSGFGYVGDGVVFVKRVEVFY